MSHSILPPSGQWQVCPMWATMNMKYPKVDTLDTIEGNSAHWVAWEVIAGRPVFEGQMTPYNIPVTQEMIEGADLIHDVVKARCPGQQLFIEQRLAIKRVHEACFGTPDIWSIAGYVIDLIDYKFGHRFVDEFENDQCIDYVSGIIDLVAEWYQIPYGQLDQLLTINVTIVQPRCFHRGKPVRTWTLKGDELRPYINDHHSAAAEALGPNPRAITNPDCRDCPGRHVCPALQKGAYSDAELALQSSPFEMSPAASALELKMLEHALGRLQARVEGLQESVKSQLLAGNSVPYYGLEKTQGKLKWKVLPEQAIAMGKLYGVDISKPGVCTPTQAKKVGIDEAVINAYSERDQGSMKLVPVNEANLRRIFGK